MPRIDRLFYAGEDDQTAANRQTASLAGMAVALFLVVVGLFLIHELHRKAVVEDCLMANRINCDKVLSDSR
jgi:uncharacterized membrane protein